MSTDGEVYVRPLVESLHRRWGRNIARARRALGMSQVDLAQRVGVCQQALSKWEGGVHAPNDRNRVALAAALGRGPYDLFPLIDEGPSEDEGTAA